MSLLTLHQGLYSALTGNAALMVVVKGVYDVPPPCASPPYLSLGAMHEVEGRLLDNTETKVFLRVHIWSQYKGHKQVLQVATLVRAALPEWTLFEDLEIMQDEEPNWWHGVMTLRAYDR